MELICDVVNPRGHATAVELAQVEEALLEHPRSSALWCLRGDLIQMSEDGEGDYVLADALASYERAQRLDPWDWEPWEAMGLYHEIDGELDEAERCLRRAVEYDGELDSWTGLARVLAAREKPEAALRTLEPGVCPFAHEPEVRELRAEIGLSVQDRED